MSHPLADIVDLDRWARGRLTVTNGAGGRGYDGGVRTYDCALCDDRRARGWLHVLSFSVGCLNAGCEAEPRLAGGAVELVRRLETLRSRGEAWQYLHREYPRVGPPPTPVLEPEVEDFCSFPAGVCQDWTGVIGREALRFARRQWGIDASDCEKWGLGWTAVGRYAWRVVIPVVMYGRTVSFQARTFRNGEPKYLMARHGGPAPECGRPAAACLFNYDAVPFGGDLMLVEGAGDAMAWERRGTGLSAVALLGQALTPQKLALLAARVPARAIVALDAGEAERRRADEHAADLEAWGIPARVGEWSGGKDSGSGASLSAGPRATLLDRVARRLGRA